MYCFPPIQHAPFLPHFGFCGSRNGATDEVLPPTHTSADVSHMEATAPVEMTRSLMNTNVALQSAYVTASEMNGLVYLFIISYLLYRIISALVACDVMFDCVMMFVPLTPTVNTPGTQVQCISHPAPMDSCQMGRQTHFLGLEANLPRLAYPLTVPSSS